MLSNRYLKKDALMANHEDPLYSQIHTKLKSVETQNRLGTPIYTLVISNNEQCLKQNKRRCFEFIATSSETPYFRHHFEDYPSILMEQFEKGAKIKSYGDEHGKWLSAFAPIRNSIGQTVAVVQVDHRFNEFLDSAYNDFIQDIILSLALLVVSQYLFVG